MRSARADPGRAARGDGGQGVNRPALDPTRAALGQALGLSIAARRLLTKVSDCGGLVERLKGLEKELAARLDNLPLQSGLELGAEPADDLGWQRSEMAWRVDQAWKAHINAWRAWKERTSGIKPANGLQLPEPLAKLIREAIRTYDKDLLQPFQRELWKRESRARAAGIGIFLDPWMTGEGLTDEQKMKWSGPYLEHDRPWKRRQGGLEPVPRFAERYFEHRQLAEEAP